jgi:aconitate hydratase
MSEPRQSLSVQNRNYTYVSLPEAAKKRGKDISRLPYTLKILLENLLRCKDNVSVSEDDILAVMDWVKEKKSEREIAYRPARVLMQDFTGVPAVVDLAAMREAVLALGGDPQKINPLAPVDLVIDHSVQVDHFGSADAFKKNVDLEMERNSERYSFLRWGQRAFENFRVVPPGTGICHQVNLEYLAEVVWSKSENGQTILYPDTLVGTDSHTTMINGLAVLGWGVGGIEAEAAMLGQPVSMVIPEVVGMELKGKIPEGITATDVVLTVTEILRKKGVVGKFVEFFGDGLASLSLADRATIANMAPEYGATCGFFPIDEETIRFLRLTARKTEIIERVEAYAKAQGLWRDANSPVPVFTETLALDLSSVKPSLAGPKRPQDRVTLSDVARSFAETLPSFKGGEKPISAPVAGASYALSHGDIVIAAITSCTNTSNPSVLLAAGLLARKARAKGLTSKPWVKTSLAPGSQVVTAYLEKTGLLKDLEELGFNIVGYGCTTCIGNSGPLPDAIENALREHEVVATSVLSGNRNFEGRVHPLAKANYLASPPLVVAYALAGNITCDLTTTAIGNDQSGNPVYLKDIWPSNQEISAVMAQAITAEMFAEKYANVFQGDAAWQAIKVTESQTYKWEKNSTYIKNPPYFENMPRTPAKRGNIENASILALLGDSVTTDHISPAGNIAKQSPAAVYLESRGVARADFNSYGARRGNDDVMVRGTFANIRLKNEMVPGTEGGVTKHIPSGEICSIFDAAMRYRQTNTPLFVIAGKEYGTGSSRDWAAKGTGLLGVKAVLAESFERIHRSNLVGMGILPLIFSAGTTRQSLKLDGSETITLKGLEGNISPGLILNCEITRANGKSETIKVTCRLDTEEEVSYYQHGGILHYVVRNLAA